MINSFNGYGVYILSAYGLTFLFLAVLLLWTLSSFRKAKRQSRTLERAKQGQN